MVCVQNEKKQKKTLFIFWSSSDFENVSILSNISENANIKVSVEARTMLRESIKWLSKHSAHDLGHIRNTITQCLAFTEWELAMVKAELYFSAPVRHPYHLQTKFQIIKNGMNEYWPLVLPYFDISLK